MEKQAVQLQGIQITFECEGKVLETFILSNNIRSEVMADERIVIYATLSRCPVCDETHIFSFLEGFDFPI